MPARRKDVTVEPQASAPLEGISEDAAQAAPEAANASAAEAPPSAATHSPSPLRTLMLSLEKEWGVAQEQALSLALALHDSGRYDVRLCCPPDSALAQRARQQKASLPLVAVSSPRNLPTLFRLWRCQQHKQPLLMHSFDADALQLAERLTHVRRAGSTVLLHSCLTIPAAMEQGDLPLRQEHKVFDALEDGNAREAQEPHKGHPHRDANTHGKSAAPPPAFAHKAWRLADRILCANGVVRSHLANSGLDTARLQVVHPGLDAAALSLRRERADGRFVFVAVESLLQGAGLFVLLRAMTALWQRTDLPPWEVRVVGAGEALLSILDEARTLGVEARLALLSRQDLGEVLPRCDALLVPNRQPCGNVLALMAAWCCALPLVYTDIAPHGEILRAAEAASHSALDSAQKTALSVPPGEAQALAADMIRLLTEPVLCANLGAQGASMREYAGYARMVAQTLRHYEDCLSRQGWVLPPLLAGAPAIGGVPEVFSSPDPGAE